jgi:hypothetical protein
MTKVEKQFWYMTGGRAHGRDAVNELLKSKLLGSHQRRTMRVGDSGCSEQLPLK